MRVCTVLLALRYRLERKSMPGTALDLSQPFYSTAHRDLCLLRENSSLFFFTVVTVTVTVTEALVLRPLLEDRGRITEAIRILVPVDRMKQECLGITMKQVRRLQQFHLRR